MLSNSTCYGLYPKRHGQLEYLAGWCHMLISQQYCCIDGVEFSAELLVCLHQAAESTASELANGCAVLRDNRHKRQNGKATRS